MKRVLQRLVVVLVVLCTAPAIIHPFRVHAQSQQDPQTITVYVTRTGAKYHRAGCRYLSRSKIAMSLAEAVKRFTPCSICRPPTLK
jgi:hypothetical protein